MKRIAAAVITVLILAAPRHALARAELTVDLALSYGGRTATPQAHREALLGMALSSMLLGDRETADGWAAGGALSVGTVDARELDLSLGGALLVPVVEAFPVILQAAPLLVVHDGGTRLGALARIGWGVHALPRLGVYALSAGLFLEARMLAAASGRPAALDWLVGADIDAFALLWPAMFLWDAMFGRAPDQ